MKRFLLCAVVGLFAMSDVAQAAEAPKFVSATFKEILSRVIRRDKDSQAILRVKGKEDAKKDLGLSFSISEILDTPRHDEAYVTLRVNLKAGDGVYERYRLRIDSAVRQELNNQNRMVALARERSIKEFARKRQEIVDRSGGTLTYGMTLEEVIKVKGQPEKVELVVSKGLAAMLRGSQITASYPDMKITFYGSIEDTGLVREGTKLIYIELTPKQQPDDKALPQP